MAINYFEAREATDRRGDRSAMLAVSMEDSMAQHDVLMFDGRTFSCVSPLTGRRYVTRDRSAQLYYEVISAGTPIEASAITPA